VPAHAAWWLWQKPNTKLIAYQIAKHERVLIPMEQHEHFVTTTTAVFQRYPPTWSAMIWWPDATGTSPMCVGGAPTLHYAWPRRLSAMTDAELERYVERAASRTVADQYQTRAGN